MKDNRMQDKSALRPSFQVLLISMSLMLFEVNLVRIFSILTYYHLAFFVLAIALFGIGLGALYGQMLRARSLFSGWIEEWTVYLPLALGFSVLIAVWALLKMPLKESASEAGIDQMRWVLAAFMVAAVPFFWGSWYISSIFASRPDSANRLYFFDLLGASLGCLLAVISLEWAGGLGTPFVAAAISILPLFIEERKTIVRRGVGMAFLLLLMIAGAWQQFHPFMSISIVDDGKVLFSQWNFFSNITISEFPNWRGWRPSRNYTGPVSAHLRITQDGRAPAFIEAFDGDLEKVKYLQYDITSLPWRIVPAKRALVIGAGGGRDILTGRVFGCPQITGVELNPTIVRAMRGPMNHYSGGVYALNGVDVHVDNGRNYMAADTNLYDLIFTSLADTQLANPQGAFVLSENYLYTVEAFESYLERLTDKGAVGVIGSIYWGGQLIRLAGTAAQALEHRGVVHPEDHILVVMTEGYGASIMKGMCLLVFKDPVSPDILARAKDACDQLGYELAFPASQGQYEWTDALRSLIQPQTRTAYLTGIYPDLSPLHDNRPYLFYPIKPQAFLKSLIHMDDPSMQEKFRLRSFHVLLNLFLVACGSVLLLMVSPLLLFRRGEFRKEGKRLQALFLLVCLLLGIGYMLIEISMLQQMFLLLGNPTLTFAVILCAMLVFTGLGSLLASRIPHHQLARAMTLLAGVAVLVQGITWRIIPGLVAGMQGEGLAAKFFLAAGLAAMLAIPMGALFPGTIRLAGRSGFDMTCWIWGMNGVGSVLGSVGATLISMNLGISATFFTGAAVYFLVTLLTLALSRNMRHSPPKPVSA